MFLDWATTLSLIFGGCCSNALTLEQITSQNPRLGNLITFAQFLLISLHGLPKFMTFTPYPKLKPRQIPLKAYILQVILFYVLSLLNNAAFAYKIPMTVHIIFRSGGLIVSMVMGWLVMGRTYRPAQILSVFVVTTGVVLTTLSASKPKQPGTSSAPNAYAFGIFLMSLALILGGFLGIIQDKMYSKYGRQATAKADASGKKPTQPWEESMFYLHFLSMPLFLLMRQDLVAQVGIVNSGPRTELVLPSAFQVLPRTSFSVFEVNHHLDATTVIFPSLYVPLILNTVTQLFCVAGVNRLTSRISSLGVTLTLVVRKALSLVISIVLFGGDSRMDSQKKAQLWGGAFLVFAGTIAYSLASSKPQPKPKKKDE
ncbi:hypothetical protein NLI96_g9887 [Meripilus lineatus]|uniref:UAA transporter n=1 Tax=Meripilus lineatus TaxID=2056292 RepID=A0AAD5UUM7_9APHY|nr:hypothetical protein NLI96_g9887 [Physisporinus lineatus]